MTSGEVLALKDESEQRPIPTAWRQIFRDAVASFVKGDYCQNGMPGLEPVPSETARQIQEYIQDYGATLVELPDETWESSVCMWYGDHWDALVDLWTRAEGPSDLVLSARVKESMDGFVVAIEMVYVP